MLNHATAASAAADVINNRQIYTFVISLTLVYDQVSVIRYVGLWLMLILRLKYFVVIVITTVKLQTSAKASPSVYKAR